MNRHTQQAEKMVAKAVGVFNVAIADVEKAQGILAEGVKQDSFKIESIKSKIRELASEMNDLESSKAEKGIQIKANNELLNKLKEFQA